ncbi:LAQU0S01e14972g1_1 [Lachancea quebecensis]|uniref:LAQU0S01e14972g1_1 n=1 Tax=Lachancea quebecensis TaxID=1654605 RepID=A0A0P1KLJ3_9SACH|nr:LAQU0S01e14972g1_1 [Lachancea quebecensis]
MGPERLDALTSSNAGSSEDFSSGSPLLGQKRLACSNCRRRRKKCDMGYPCASCVKMKLDCNVNMDDMRKKRYAAGYVKSLEAHVAYLETRLKNLDTAKTSGMSSLGSSEPTLLISADSKERGLSGRTVPLNSSVAEFSHDSDNSMRFNASENDILRRKRFVKGSIYPEGPASYKPQRREPAIIKPQNRIADLKTTVIVRRNQDSSETLNTDKNILGSLSAFYKWLYPGPFVFVHRESFLYGFFNHSEDNYENSQYCSEELVYAVASVGSRLVPGLRSLSESYYQKAKEKLLTIVFDEHSTAKITTVQALLCLAFYELGKGNNQLAWYFSGLAIRVGYDMGFQLDPKVWVTDDASSSELSQSELEIRSRIYWGCYIADHFICLLLGRTSTLSVSNSTVPESDELPEVDGTGEFRFNSKHVLQVSLPLKNLVILSRIVQVFTAKIFIESGSTAQRIGCLTRFNIKVYNWRQSLPQFLKWSKNSIKDTDWSTDPTISYFWYHYYIVLLTFNKPFMEDCEESKILVLEVLGELHTLLSNFRTRFGSVDTASIYQVYSSLLAVTCLKKLTKMPLDGQPAGVLASLDRDLRFYTDLFHEFRLTYGLPQRLQDEPDLHVVDQLNTLAYTHDFSLSDEIDDLIKQVFGFDTWTINPSHSV